MSTSFRRPELEGTDKERTHNRTPTVFAYGFAPGRGDKLSFPAPVSVFPG